MKLIRIIHLSDFNLRKNTSNHKELIEALLQENNFFFSELSNLFVSSRKDESMRSIESSNSILKKSKSRCSIYLNL